MTVNSYLHNKASLANLSQNERDSITRSILTLRARLDAYFGDEVLNHFIFGSHSRGTILPRSMDAESDVDYMVVFTDGGYQPQTYLDKLKRFAEYHYRTSEIAQSHPTIQLELNHIRFELVPALIYYSDYHIPDKSYGYERWISTDPHGCKARLEECNNRHNWYIKPTIRLIKYWNATRKRPFESYELEQLIVEHFRYYSPLNGGYWGYLKHFVLNMQIPWDIVEWKRERMQVLRKYTEVIDECLRYGYEDKALVTLRRLLP